MKKNKNLKTRIVLFFMVLLIMSCSKNDDNPVVPVTEKLELKGLFKMDTSFSIDDENFLFENNKLFIGNDAGSIHQTLLAGGNLSNESVAFTYNVTTNKINFTHFGNQWEATYEPTNGKIVNGIVKSSNGVNVLGSFTGQKYIPQDSGVNLFNGHWKGKYGIGTAVPDIFFNLIIENGSLVVVRDDENSLNNDITSSYGLSLNAAAISNKTITCIYQYIGGQTYAIQATYNSTTQKLEGTWGSGINTSGGGTIVFESQNFN